MTTREPLRDVVARSLAIPGHDKPVLAITTHDTMLVLIAEHVDRLYVAVEKLTAAVQLIIDELKVGKPDDAPSAKQSGETAR